MSHTLGMKYQGPKNNNNRHHHHRRRRHRHHHHHIFCNIASLSYYLIPPNGLTLRIFWLFSACRRPPVCRLSVTFVRPTQAIEIFSNVSTLLRHLVRWPSVDIHVKFYGGCPMGTPPSKE